MNFVCHGAVGQADTNLSDIAWRSINSTHNALIVAFEENADEGEGLDGDVELRRRQPLPESGVPHGVHWGLMVFVMEWCCQKAE